jgi:hypothetical protein
VRIESILQLSDGTLRLLDMQNADVRDAVRDFEGSQVTVLFESNAASTYA